MEAHFGAFEDSANLDENRSTVCVEHTISSEIVLEALDGMPR